MMARFGRLSLFASVLAAISGSVTSAAEPLRLEIHYIVREKTPPPTLSNLDPFEPDVGQQGALLGIADSNTTGRFLGQEFILTEHTLAEGQALATALPDAPELAGLIVTNMPADDLTGLSALLKDENALIFNASAADTDLRNAACLGNVLHTVPSWTMLSDALAQFALQKRWTRWLLLSGPTGDDRQFADALRRSAEKYGSKIVDEAEWDAESDLRRNAHEEIPRLTNGSKHDLVAVADTLGDFARYLPYNTYHPRPVVGSEGLSPVAWSPVVEQWGAAQLQRRFVKQAKRPMRSVDYAAWAAIRSIAEAAARTKSNDPATLRAYLLADKFQLAAFKGRKMSFRDWNGQLRQPIPLVHPRALVAQAPFEGFLHPVSEMDTLGLDRRTSKCEAFAKP